MFVSFLVNVEEEDLRNDGDPCIYPTQYGEDDYPYADCVYIPEPEHSPYLKVGMFYLIYSINILDLKNKGCCFERIPCRVLGKMLAQTCLFHTTAS